jgi:hypothetical protein
MAERFRPAIRILAASLAAAIVGSFAVASATAAPGDPKQRHTAAGAATAFSVLLKKSDFGAGWKAKTSAPSKSSNVCKNRPNQSDLTEIGFESSPDFSFGQAQQISQNARVFATKAQADAAWMRTVTIALLDCFRQEIESASDAKSTVKVTGMYRLPFANLTPHLAAFRVVAHAKTPDAQFDVYTDIVLMGRDRTITTATFTGFGSPVRSGFESGLARTIARRLGANVAGPKS